MEKKISLRTMASVKRKHESEKELNMPESSHSDSQELKERIESVLRDASRDMATVLLLMPQITPTETGGSSIKTRDSFDISFSTIDSDEETIEDWLDEIEEELVGLYLLPKEDKISQIRMKQEK